jgi:hypothetical protein
MNNDNLQQLAQDAVARLDPSKRENEATLNFWYRIILAALEQAYEKGRVEGSCEAWSSKPQQPRGELITDYETGFKDVVPPEQPCEPWTVEQHPSSCFFSMARIMQGDKVIIGWTMRPFSESFDMIAGAHNATLQPAHASGVEFHGDQNLSKEG